MPIVLAQPDPYAGVAAGGSAQLAALAQRYATGSQANMQARQQQDQAAMQNAASFTRSAEADGQMSQQRQMFEAARQDRANEFNATQMPSARDNFLADAEQAQQVRRAETQAWVSQQEITQQETARLNRMQQSVSEIEAMVQAKKLDRGDADNLIAQARTGIDLLKQKLEAAKARAEQEQVNKAQAQAKLVTNLQSEDVATRNAAAARLIRTNPDGSQGFVGYDGKWVETMKATKAEKAAKVVPFSEDRAAKDAAAEARVAHPPSFGPDGKEIENPNYRAYLSQVFNRKRQEHTALHGQPPGPAAPPVGGPDAAPRAVPYSRTAPPDKLTPEQQNQVQNFAAGMKSLAERPDADQPHVRGAIESLNKVQDLTEQYGGDPAAMPPAVREEIRRRVGEIEKVQQTPPPPPPPAPRHGGEINPYGGVPAY